MNHYYGPCISTDVVKFDGGCQCGVRRASNLKSLGFCYCGDMT